MHELATGSNDILKAEWKVTNYPNPFHSNTTIEYSLDSQQEITIKIYDLNGRLVESLATQLLQNAGKHHVTWEAENITKGTYFCKISAPGQWEQTIKMVKR